MYRNTLEKSKGITLVALVITIIILLILSGVVLSLIIGENGLVQKAKQSKEISVIAGEKEIINMGVSSVKIKKIQEGVENYQLDANDLQNELQNENVTVTPMGNLIKIFFIESSNEYIIDKDAKIFDEKELANVILYGEGTEENPYLINHIEDLVAFAHNVKKGNSYKEKFLKLNNDLDFNDNNSYIDANAKSYVDSYGETIYYGDYNNDGENDSIKENVTKGTGFYIIGDSQNAFEGTFLGNNKKINNIYINYTTSSEGYYECAGLFAYSKGIISDLETTGTIKANYSKELILGGIVGRIVGPASVKNCKNNINIEVTGANDTADVGGIVGNASSVWENNWNSNISNCSNYGKIEVKGVNEITVGGISGYISNVCIVTESINYGEISGISIKKGCDVIVGGVIGDSNLGIVNKSVNKGNATAQNENGGKGYIGIMDCGGILGRANSGAYIYNCYNTGDICAENTSRESGYVGGILGRPYQANEQTIVNCYNSGKILGNMTSKGGISGELVNYTYNVYNVGICDNGISYLLGSNSLSKHRNMYYLDAVSSKGTSYLQNVEDTTESKTNEEMMSQEFVDLLNQNVDSENSNSPKVQLVRWKKGDTYPVFDY